MQINKQRGTAIIVALFIVALIATAAIAMIQRLQIDLRKTELIIRSDQAYLYNQGSLAWAKETLNQAWKRQKPNQVVDGISPISYPKTKEGPYTISGSLIDIQGRFNLNNLTDPLYHLIFSRLIQVVSPNIDQATSMEIVKAIVDWITPGLKETPFDAYYLKLNPPYHAAHNLMASVSELLLVKGITPDLFSKLEPYITALPVETQININNASIPVLMSLSPTVQLDTAKQIAALGKRAPFSDPQKFLTLDIVKNNQIPPGTITVTSNYFLLTTNVTVDQQKMTINTLLNRVAKEKQTRVLTIWQSKGTL